MLFETASDKDASLESLLEIQQVFFGGGQRSWGVGFMRNFNDWEIDMAASFLHLLESYIPTREGEDRMRGKLKSNREFM